ncbi:hypothetical protein FOA52_011973 [Chlamydomonas sp. UWO 241]|nr:hypothetical protein FOA52_011973 [Chlamydomonas sp. UWO 241]
MDAQLDAAALAHGRAAAAGAWEGGGSSSSSIFSSNGSTSGGGSGAGLGRRGSGGFGGTGGAGGRVVGPEELVSLALCLPTLNAILCGGSSSGERDGEGRGGGREGAVDGGGAGGGEGARAWCAPPGLLPAMQALACQQLPAFDARQLANAARAAARVAAGARPVSEQGAAPAQQRARHEAGGLQLAGPGEARASGDGRRGDAQQLPAHPQQQGSGCCVPPLSPPLARQWLRCAARAAPEFSGTDAAAALWALATLQRAAAAGAGASPASSAGSTAAGWAAPAAAGAAGGGNRPTHTSGGSGGASRATSGGGGAPRVPREWLDHFLPASRSSLRSASPQDLALSLWALSAIGQGAPPWQWVLAFFEASGRAVAEAAAAAVTSGQRLPSVPGTSGGTAADALRKPPAAGGGGAGGADGAQGQGREQQQPPRAAAQQPARQPAAPPRDGRAAARGPRLVARDLAMMLHAAGALWLRPLAPWAAAAVSALGPALAARGAGSGRGGGGGVDAGAGVDARNRDALTGQQAAGALWGVYRLRLAVRGPALEALLRGARAAARGMAREDAAVAAWAVAGLWANARARGGGGSGGGVFSGGPDGEPGDSTVARAQRRRPRGTSGVGGDVAVTAPAGPVAAAAHSSGGPALRGPAQRTRLFAPPQLLAGPPAAGRAAATVATAATATAAQLQVQLPSPAAPVSQLAAAARAVGALAAPALAWHGVVAEAGPASEQPARPEPVAQPGVGGDPAALEHDEGTAGLRAAVAKLSAAAVARARELVGTHGHDRRSAAALARGLASLRVPLPPGDAEWLREHAAAQQQQHYLASLLGRTACPVGDPPSPCAAGAVTHEAELDGVTDRANGRPQNAAPFVGGGRSQDAAPFVNGAAVSQYAARAAPEVEELVGGAVGGSDAAQHSHAL